MRNKIVHHSNSWTNGVDTSVNLLRRSKRKEKFLFEQNRNLGDTLHLVPIIRHYRQLHPEASMLMLVGKPYCNAWAYNEDINNVITVPSLNPQLRIKLRKRLLQYKDQIKIISPSIFPYGEIWKELKWCHENIADQYLHNAGIKDLKPVGGRRLLIGIDNADREWAATFAHRHGLNKTNSVGFEYISYSHQPIWQVKDFKQLRNILNKHGIKCISFAGRGEPLVKGTLDARGLSWRKTVALMNHLGAFCGIGSGMTMVAAAAEKQPKILELAVSASITMKRCGYAPSLKVPGKDVSEVARLVKKQLEA